MDESYENLLSEVLLGLLGHIGGAFVIPTLEETVPGLKPKPVLSEHVDWVDAAEREQLERLIKLGSYFADLEAFVESSLSPPSDQERRSSIYVGALANGISEVLDLYRSTVVQIENNLVRSPAPPLLALQQALTEYEVLLPELALLVDEVEHNDLKGSQVVRMLETQARSGNPSLQACARRLLWHCHRIMFKQLEAWLVHGMLLDPAGEFFIQYKSGDGISTTTTNSAPVLHHGSSVNLEQQMAWHDGFRVSLADLPSSVDLPTAESILFIGKAVRVLRQPTTMAASDYVLRAHTEVLAFSSVLQDIQKQNTLLPVAFQRAIDNMRAKVAGLLWELVEEQCDLAGRLAAFQSFFLLGRGDLYQQFLQDGAPLLTKPPRSATAEEDIFSVFQQAAIQTGSDLDPHFSSFRLRWSVAEPSALPVWHPARAAISIPAFDAWDGLYLEYEVQWPLQLFFPPEVLRKYGALWQYMFRLKRVQADLHDAWALLQASGRRGKAKNDTNRLHARLGRLRQRIAHFLDNLQLYTQLDVVEAACETLKERISASKDFTEAFEIHRACLDSMATQAFLDTRLLMGMIEAILLQARKLCTLVNDISSATSVPENALDRMEEIDKDFTTKHALLFQLMQSTKLQSMSRAPALRQLILRLNFNSFCELQLQDVAWKESDSTSSDDGNGDNEGGQIESHEDKAQGHSPSSEGEGEGEET